MNTAARRPSVAVLVLLSGVSPLATDMYISGLPGMALSLSAPAAVIQLSLTTFLVGMAVGQLVIGPISDGLGRKPFLVIGPIAFTALSLVCALAQDAHLLAGVRFFQGLAGAAGMVVARAVVTDYFERMEAARTFALIASVTAFGPVVAPVLGGLILTAGSWRLIFLVLAGVGLLMLAGVILTVPETLPREARLGSSFRETLGRMGDLLRDTRFMGFVITGCFMSGGLFTYVGGSSFVLNEVYGVNAQLFTVIFAVNSCGIVLSSLIFRRLIGRVVVRKLLAVGLTISTTAALTLAIRCLVSQPPLWQVWALLFLMVCGVGLINPGFVTLAQRAGVRTPGTASALQGGFQFFFGALVTPLTGILGYGSLVPMTATMAVLMLAAFTLNRVLAHVQRDRMPELD